MSAPKYITEGRVEMTCRNGNAKPVALTWRVDGVVCVLHGGSGHIELSKSQLEQPAEHAASICMDLNPNRVMEAKKS